MARERWVEVGRIGDIPRRGARRVTRPGGAVPIAVFRTAEDAIFALVDRCPHRGGPLSEGIVQGSGVACPLHGWVIDLADGRAEVPDEGCTETVAVRIRGDRILLSAAALEMAGRLRWEAA
jgi:nitrite reductase (NADH) small subunit